jgi:hypothetical protein
MGLILLIVFIVLLILLLPTWPYSRAWGYQPTGLVTAAIVLILILIFLNVIGFWRLEVTQDDNQTQIKIIENPQDY